MTPLERLIDEELRWREAELASLKLALVRELHDQQRFRTQYRCYVAIAYAHYEGLLKTVAAQKLISIKATGIKPSQCNAFIKVALFANELRKHIGALSNDDLIVFASNSQCIDALQFPSEQKFFEISNLNWSNLSWMISCVGLNPAPFSKYRRYISHLVDLRHRCAHGERLSFDSSKTAKQLADEIFHVQGEVMCAIHDIAIQMIN